MSILHSSKTITMAKNEYFNLDLPYAKDIGGGKDKRNNLNSATRRLFAPKR